MMSNVKRAFRLLGYGYQVKLNLILGCFFLLFGVAVKIVGMVTGGFEIIFLLLPSIFVCQILYGLEFINMISSSNEKRLLTVVMPDIIVNICMLAGLLLFYLLDTCLKGRTLLGEEYQTFQYMSHSTGNAMFLGGMMAFIMMCFVAGCYKYYWGFTVVFMIMMMGYGALSSLAHMFLPDLTSGQGILAAVLFYAAGVIAGGVIRRWLYRVPVSGWAIGKRLGGRF